MKRKLSATPFHPGQPVSTEREYTIRGKHLGSKTPDIITKILRGMQNGACVSLVGERRTGKTSTLLFLLNNAEKLGLESSHLLVYFDFQTLPVNSTELQVYQSIVNSIYDRLNKRKHKIKARKEITNTSLASTNDFHNYTEKLLELGLTIHFLFDEFDQVEENTNIGVNFLNTLRSMANPHLSYIIASRKELNVIEHKVVGKERIASAFHNIFTSEILVCFTYKDFQNFINKNLMRMDKGSISEEQRFQLAEKFFSISDILYDTTGYHPYFLQLLCYYLFLNMEEGDWQIDYALESSLLAFVTDASRIFENYWELSSVEEQLGLTMLSNGEIPDTVIINRLKNRCLVLASDGSDRIFSDFFKAWIKKELSDVFVRDFIADILGKGPRSEKEFHIFTGGKGGVGKTLLSLGKTLSFDESKNILCVDLNWENPDYSRILYQSKSPELGVNKFSYVRIQENILVLRPAEHYNIPNGALGFWQTIRESLQESYHSHKFDPTVVIVDTNLHFASLLRWSGGGSSAARIIKRIDAIAKENRISALNFWFIWTTASFFSDSLIRIAKSYSYFVNNLNKNYFSEKNFIHVLNLSAIYPMIGLDRLYDRLRKLEKQQVAMPAVEDDLSVYEFIQVDELNRLSNMPKADHINLQGLIDPVKVALENSKRTKFSNKFPTDIVEKIAEKLLETYKNSRPSNLVIIPFYDATIAGYTDIAEISTIDDLKRLLDSIIGKIKKQSV